MLQQIITQRFLNALDGLAYGSMVVTAPDGKQYAFKGAHDGPDSSLVLHDWRAIPMLAAKGDIGFTEAYREGYWDSDDITALLQVGLMNEHALDGYIYGSMLSRMACRGLYLFTQNSLRGSKRNIHAHYDLGNDFYALWLDSTMSYSAALFEHKDEPLEQAQKRKNERILHYMNKQSGRMLEIGCGWGGFAEQAMEYGDYDFRGVTLSQQQKHYAEARMEGKAQIVLEDYRHQEGKYDHIVSIEMFEAVGEKYWPVYFDKLKSLLRHNGRAMLQTITIAEPYFDRYRKGGDMIRSFIFPGGMLPTPSAFKEQAQKSGLQVTDSYAFGKDYAETLRRWLNNFEARLPEVRAQGFDERFIRVWRFYLAACIASFDVSRTDVMQMELRHA